MDLEIKDVANLLNVSEAAVKRWVSAGEIPFYQMNHQCRFSRMEIEDWLLHGKSLGADLSLRGEGTPAEGSYTGTQHFCLYRALHQGDVLMDVPGEDKEALLCYATIQIAPKLNVDPDVLRELLLDRERMMPTGLNQGIAVPHTRDFLCKGPFDRVFVVYPQQPLAYGALDGQDVHTLFFLFAGQDKAHLQLLAKLAHLATQLEASTFLQKKPLKRELLDFIRQWESRLVASLVS